MAKFKVLIIGAGLGGLCLAQNLRCADIDVEVFERDASPWDRAQGYRLHMDIQGVNALRASLPPRSFATFEATAMRPVDSTTILSVGLEELRRIPSDDHSGTVDNGSSGGKPVHLNVDRATVRQILLTGLDDVCHFNARFERYESGDGVTAHFVDGLRARGDVLVGADGIASTVRKQRAPSMRTMDAGLRAIYGRIPLERSVNVVPRSGREDVFSIAIDAKKVFLGMGPMIFPVRPDVASQSLLPEAQLEKQSDYVVCIVGGRQEHFGPDEKSLHQAASTELQHRAVAMLSDWSSAASAIPSHGDPDSFFYVDMYSSVPSTLEPATSVTLLGDAVHSMTPTLGRGANIAMRDAALLGRLITATQSSRSGIASALNAYEKEMTAYGFDVVRKAAAMGQRLVAQNPLP